MNRRLVSFILGFALPLHAATITVTTTTDELNADGDWSLRERRSPAGHGRSRRPRAACGLL